MFGRNVGKGMAEVGKGEKCHWKQLVIQMGPADDEVDQNLVQTKYWGIKGKIMEVEKIIGGKK